MPRHLLIRTSCVALFLAAPALAQPETPAPPSQAQRLAESQNAEKAGFAAAVKGPSTIALADQATLRLPGLHAWIPRPQAARMLRAWGNHPSSELLGLVAGRTGGHEWIATVSFTGDGYVKDDDAKDIDPSKLLADMRESAAAEAEDRKARGFPAMLVGNWLQRPRYDSAAKRLVWALPLYDEGQDPDEATINYNTRALGRNGYLSLNLLTDKAHFAAEQPEAEALLGDLAYLPGKRYADFQPSSDRVAEYGVAALIGAVALKKLGIIALGTAVVVKFAKVGILAVVAAGAAVRRFFGGRKKDQRSV
jgi:uncharacterized membrane-anchored protein